MQRRTFTTLLPKTVGALLTANIFISEIDHQEFTSTMPHKIKLGDTIGMISPSSPTSEENLVRAIKNLESLGFRVKLSSHLNKATGFLAGTDIERVADLHEMLDDPEVKAIWCMRGGYGSARLLALLDFEKVKAAKKIIVGFSDVTALLNGIYTKTGLQVIHGPVGTSEYTDYTKKQILSLLLNGEQDEVIEPCKQPAEDELHPIAIKSGIAEGRLVGGNLTVFASLCGTEYMPDCKGAILFLEDIGEVPYKIDRCLNQLKQNIDFNELAGIVFGNFNNCEPKGGYMDMSLQGTLIESVREYNFPVVYGFSFGHIKNLCSFPVGRVAELDTNTMIIKLK